MTNLDDKIITISNFLDQICIKTNIDPIICLKYFNGLHKKDNEIIEEIILFIYDFMKKNNGFGFIERAIIGELYTNLECVNNQLFEKKIQS